SKKRPVKSTPIKSTALIVPEPKKVKPVEKKKKEPSGKKKESGRSPGVPDQNQRSFNFERVWVDEQLE
ncbi:MAG: hypothetical protein MK438_09390, partial [SAR324 cluster bacterium]|nr:hypothetical protein [SAR324 cluster bacterium]